MIRESVLPLFGHNTIRTLHDSVLNVYFKNISVIMCWPSKIRLSVIKKMNKISGSNITYTILTGNYPKTKSIQPFCGIFWLKVFDLIIYTVLRLWNYTIILLKHYKLRLKYTIIQSIQSCQRIRSELKLYDLNWE